MILRRSEGNRRTLPALQRIANSTWASSESATRLVNALTASILVVGLFVTPVQAQLFERPITPGFWSFPRQKAASVQDILAACREHFELEFPDGHFFGVRPRTAGRTNIQPEVDDVGHCAFNHHTQVEHCDMKESHPDGSVLVGTRESKYSFDADKTLRMTVTPKMITDTPFSDTNFDVFPVRCPDESVWGGLNEIDSPKR